MKNKMTTGITFSSFDLLHAGHILMLKECRENCDYLIAALQVDPTKDRPSKNSPTQSIYERFVQLSAVKYVDEIIVYETEYDLEQIILSQNIDIRFIGEDYVGKDFTAKNICEDLGIEIYYNRRQHSFSSSELKARILNNDIINT